MKFIVIRYVPLYHGETPREFINLEHLTLYGHDLR